MIRVVTSASGGAYLEVPGGARSGSSSPRSPVSLQKRRRSASASPTPGRRVGVVAAPTLAITPPTPMLAITAGDPMASATGTRSRAPSPADAEMAAMEWTTDASSK
ncbi:unnamed protein product, partial [Meganyctiphanes norvegica]